MANSCDWRDGALRRAASVAGSGSTMPSAPDQRLRQRRPRVRRDRARAWFDLHQIARASRGGGAAQLQRSLERSEIVFGVVDGVARVGGRGPIQARRSGAGGALFEFAQGRQAAFGGADHFERVERRHAGAGLRNVHARIRDDQALGGGSGGGTQQHAFARDAVGLVCRDRRRV